MSLFKTIVAAVDFSASSLTALDEAIALATDAGAALHVLTVVPDPSRQQWSAEAVGADLDAMRNEWVHTAERQMVALEQSRNLAPNVQLSVRVGGAAEEIVRYAAESAANLIVLGRHGQGALRRLLLGSVADKVVRQAGCPVLVTPH